MRTTLDIDKPVLEALKKLQRREKRSLGKIASSLLAEALKRDAGQPNPESSGRLDWAAADLGARVDIADKDSLYRALDGR